MSKLTLPTTSAFGPSSWGEVEITWLYSTLKDFEDKILSCRGLTTSVQTLTLQLSLLSGKVDALQDRIDNLSQPSQDSQHVNFSSILAAVTPGLHQIQNIHAQNVTENFNPHPGVQHLESAALPVDPTIIKQETNDTDLGNTNDTSQPDADFADATGVTEYFHGFGLIDRNSRRRRIHPRHRRYARVPLPEAAELSAPVPSSVPPSTATGEQEVGTSSSSGRTENYTSMIGVQGQIVLTPNLELLETSRELLGDVQRNATTGKFPCPDPNCSKQFTKKRDLGRHHLLHTGIRPYACTLCPDAFTRADHVIHHMRVHHFGLPGKVPPKVKKQKQSKTDTTLPQSTEFLCRRCPVEIAFTFTSLEELADHYVKQHKPPGGLKTIEELSRFCKICGKPCYTKKRLDAHVITHTGEDREDDSENTDNTDKSFPCEVCGKAFPKRLAMLRHRRTVHPTAKEVAALTRKKMLRARRERELAKNPKHPCPDCGKKYRTPRSARIHLIRCRKLKPFACEICGLGFSVKIDVEYHRQRVHEKIKRFLCPDCGKGFYGAEPYERHMRIHRGIKPYLCKHCGRGFTVVSSMKKHEQIHTKERNFHCQQCDQKFFLASSLERHVRVRHTKERPYMCDVCGVDFAQKGDLTRHKGVHARLEATQASPIIVNRWRHKVLYNAKWRKERERALDGQERPEPKESSAEAIVRRIVESSRSSTSNQAEAVGTTSSEVVAGAACSGSTD